MNLFSPEETSSVADGLRHEPQTGLPDERVGGLACATCLRPVIVCAPTQAHLRAFKQDVRFCVCPPDPDRYDQADGDHKYSRQEFDRVFQIIQPRVRPW